ncbi:MAG: SRPBCC family protein [Deltaproteobacteria bacterium]|nr:SRPBCC family protein [Deltaproteobacteria bacterium]
MGALSEFTTYAKATGSRLSDQPLLFETTRHLDVTQRELFNYVTDFDRASEWIWAAKKTWADDTKAQIPGQVGSVRMIQGAAGKPMRETVKEFEAPRLLAYSAHDAAFPWCAGSPTGGFRAQPSKPGWGKSCSKSHSATV